jgi:DNA-binding transcriptional LysR family regulator
MSISRRAMTYLTTALRRGSIAGTATELDVAASAVAAALDQVEDALGLTLVTRQRARGIRPNASGLFIARKLERLLEEYRAVLAERADLGEAIAGPLWIGYYAPMAPAFLPQILAQVAPRAGDVALHLVEWRQRPRPGRPAGRDLRRHPVCGRGRPAHHRLRHPRGGPPTASPRWRTRSPPAPR